MKTLRNLALIVVALGLSACASSAAAENIAIASPTASPTQSHRLAGVDPCTLVTAAEASAAGKRTLANLVTLGASRVPGACFYGARGTTAGVFVYMQVYGDAKTAAAVTVEQLQSVMTAQLGDSFGDATVISGVGDKAYEFTAKGKAGAGIAVVVYRSNVVFLVAVEPVADASVVEGLATTAANRLHA